MYPSVYGKNFGEGSRRAQVTTILQKIRPIKWYKREFLCLGTTHLEVFHFTDYCNHVNHQLGLSY